MEIKGTNVLSTIKLFYNIFTKKQKARFNWLIVLTFFGSVTDIIGLVSILPIIGLVLNDAYYHTFIKAVPFFASFDRNHLLLIMAGLLMLLIIGKNAFGLFVNKKQVDFVQALFISSSMNVLNKVYDRSLQDLQKDTSNELANKLTALQITLCSNAALSTMIIINETIVFALTAVIALISNWQLFLLIIVVVMPSIGLFYNKVKNTIKKSGSLKSEKINELYSRAQEMVYGYIDIKIAGTERSFKNKFKEVAQKYSKYQGQLDLLSFVPTRIIDIAIFLCTIIILLFGVFVIKDTTKILSTISLLAMIAYRCVPSINRFVVAMSALNATEFIFHDPEFIPEENRVEDPIIEPLSFKNRIVFEDVSYRYTNDSKYVVKDCNLEITKGEKIGIIGKSGAGKSTLINNILGFLHPSEGTIRIDNTLLTADNVKAWWKIVGYVRQEVFIMNATFMENIAIGEPFETIDVERVKHAVQMASLNELVADMPNGLSSMLTEKGNNLSGGQKQRVSIARAIYKGAEILIFDEATSALDTKTEEDITNAIKQLGNENLTIIIIAHRYTSLKYCDKIYALDKGHISNCFSYNELVAQANS